ncbi:hypothetical protein I302_107825 [Kwoniella bestiolae CBS 10118]|uniref:Uncharacterized protein n=1 Tax=Kwoniella bestiolae CBS 10118 TaxID=1296100 RepID=A0A1B9FXF4_9TREE|nr:hypothetical protein I302_06435 [Kwoniella bestiolae CBS 10118]OCF23453.1 hypothetical protein I302_06435 [Kwoniella bestiolae CBS 10118]
MHSHPPSPRVTSGCIPSSSRSQYILADLQWIPIPTSRPRQSSQDKIRLSNLLSPRPSLNRMRSSSTLTKSSSTLSGSRHPISHESASGSTLGRGDLTSIRRKGSRIWSKAKEAGRKASLRHRSSPSSTFPGGPHNTPRGTAGSTSDEEEEEWEIVTPPMDSSEFTSTASPSHPSMQEEEEMFEGARGTGTISRISQRAQQGSALDLLDTSLNGRTSISPVSHITRNSGSGSGSGERSLEVDLGDYRFPTPPTHLCPSDTNPRPSVKPKRSWLEGGPLTVPAEHEEQERKLPDDHPFNSPVSSDQSHRASSLPSRMAHHTVREQSLLQQSEAVENRYNLLRSLHILRSELYHHNLNSIKILSSFEDILPPSISNGINRRLDVYWNKWSTILNTAGTQITTSLPSPPPHSGEYPTSMASQEHSRLKGLIPPPLTSDEMERLVWTLEESGKVASGTYRRMFGAKSRPRIMTSFEEKEADERGLRGWMVGEEERQDRDRWREGKRG